jgi:hypothetical protein
MSTILLTAAIILSGCHWLIPPLGPAPQTAEITPVKASASTRDTQSVDALLNYYRLTGEISPAIVPDRIDRLRSHLTEGRCDGTRLRTAMLASRLPPGEGEQLGMKLLEPCVENPFARYSPAGVVAILLNDMLENRAARLEASAAHAREQSRARELAVQVERLEAEVSALEQQLEGLKAIERSIQQRDRERAPGE